MKGRLGMLVGAISLLSVGALLAQQPTQSGAKATQPAAQAQQAQQPAPAAKAQAAPKAQKMKAAAPKWTKDQIKDAQEALTRAKIYTGKADGVFNAATRRAVRTYQQQHKMKVTGQLSDSLLAELKAIP